MQTVCGCSRPSVFRRRLLGWILDRKEDTQQFNRLKKQNKKNNKTLADTSNSHFANIQSYKNLLDGQTKINIPSYKCCHNLHRVTSWSCYDVWLNIESLWHVTLRGEPFSLCLCCGLNPEWTLELHVCVEPVPSANICGLNAFLV